MTRSEILEFFAEWEKAWASKDPDRLAACHAADGKVSSPMFKQLSGRTAIAESYYRLFEMFPDWTITNEDLLIDDNRVARPFQATATHIGEFMGLPGSGRKFQIQGVRLFKMNDGLIQEERRLYDFTNFLIQIGVLRSKPGY